MHRGQPDSGCPKAVYFPACGKPGRAPAGKRGRNTAFFAYLQGIRLTREGELLFRYVKTGVEQLLEGGRMLERMLDMDMGEVRIGASDMTLQFYLLPFLERFHEKYPKVKVTVSNGPTPETLGFLSHGTIDFGVVSSPVDARPEVSVTEVKKIRNIFVAGEQFKHLKGEKAGIRYSERTSLYFSGKEYEYETVYG